MGVAVGIIGPMLEKSDHEVGPYEGAPSQARVAEVGGVGSMVYWR